MIWDDKPNICQVYRGISCDLIYDIIWDDPSQQECDVLGILDPKHKHLMRIIIVSYRKSN